MTEDKTYQAFLNQYGVTNGNDDLRFYFNFLTLDELNYIADEISDKTDADFWLSTLNNYVTAQSKLRDLCAQLDHLAKPNRQDATVFNVNFAVDLSETLKKLELTHADLLSQLRFNNPSLIAFYRNRVVHTYLFLTPQMKLADWRELNDDVSQIIKAAITALDHKIMAPKIANTAFKLPEPPTFAKLATSDPWFAAAKTHFTITPKAENDFNTYLIYHTLVKDRAEGAKLRYAFRLPTDESFAYFYSHVVGTLSRHQFLAALLDVYQITDKASLTAFYRKWNQWLATSGVIDADKFFHRFLMEYRVMLAEKTWKYFFKLNYQIYPVADSDVLSATLYFILTHIDDEDALLGLRRKIQDPTQLARLAKTGAIGAETKVDLADRYYHYPPFCDNRFTQQALIYFVKNYNALNENERQMYANFIHNTKSFIVPKDANTALMWVKYFLKAPNQMHLAIDVFNVILKYCKNQYNTENYNLEELAEDLLPSKKLSRTKKMI